MSETRPTYIPCAAGGQSQRECLFRIIGSLVLGHANMHLTPADARSAAQALWAMADSIEGKKTPRIDSDAVEALIAAAEDVVEDMTPAGMEEVLIDVMTFIALEKALNTLTGDA